MTIHITRTGLDAEWVIAPGSLLVQRIWAEIHISKSNSKEDIESARSAWIHSRLEEVIASIEGEESVKWNLESVEWPASFESFGMDKEPIKIRFSTNLSFSKSDSLLILDNQYLDQISVTWYYLHGKEGIRFQPPKQKKGRIKIKITLQETTQPDDSSSDNQEGNLLDYWESGTPSLPGFVENLGRKIAEEGGADMRQPQQRGSQAILTGFMRTTKASVGFYLAAFGIAFILGALHAVTPGHGKTIMAAYLVGAHGKLWHAFALGAIVTFTHTGSVFFLGLATLVASRYIMPESLFPILQISSGLLILIFGIYFLRQRWRIWRSGKKVAPEQEDAHLPMKTDYVTWRTMIVLGVSSGLVPCPGATTILLTAVSINRISLGLILIAFFSLGLASTLITIGAVMVQGRRVFDRIGPFQRLIPVMPVVSAVLLLFLGSVLTINAIRISLLFLPSSSANLSPSSLSRKEDGVLFLSFDDKRQRQIFLSFLEKNKIYQITHEDGSIIDYAVSPDKARFVYTLLHDESRTDIFLLDFVDFTSRRLTTATDASFSRPVFAPDGKTIVYERRDYSVSSAIDAPSLWWMNPDSGDTGPLFQDDQLPCRYPSWSFDGEWLSYSSYFSASRNGLLLYNLKDGRRIELPYKPQGFVSWHPSQHHLIFTELRPRGYDIKPTKDQRFDRQLLQYHVKEENLLDLCKGKQTNDMYGVWSPDGEKIAVIRRELSGPLAKWDQQIWLMKPDGSQAEILTQLPDAYFGSLTWSSDGKSLLFNKWHKESLYTKSELWFLDIETKESRMLVPSGSGGEWITSAGEKATALRKRQKSFHVPSAQ
ncbi:sulfite exporter TauE/SafE family protein [Candidatus Sumerlaeota bacterium]|nr:sulfite exporter TauE/SafE family protein [Candidatus Sumerlaeota bacterium]